MKSLAVHPLRCLSVRRGYGQSMLPVAAAGLALCLATQRVIAQADTVTPPTDRASSSETSYDDNAALSEVVVTAQKRLQNVQKVPLAITTLSGDDLRSHGISEVADLQGFAPAVEFQPVFAPLVYVRGIGNYNLQPGFDPSVAYNLDGVYLSHQYALPPLFDLERVEVLRGPQGTLYGKNTIGGTLNFIATRPQNKLEGHFSLGLGNFESRSAEAVLNVPISDRFVVRAAAMANERDGYLDNGYMDANNVAGRLRLLALPRDNVELLITADYARKDEDGSGASPCTKGTDVTVYPGCAGVPWRPFLGLAGQGVDPSVNLDNPNYLQSENRGVYAELNIDTGFGTLTYVPSYRSVDYRNLQTYSPTYGYAPLSDNRMTTHEVRLASPESSRVEWVVGAYYSDEDSRDRAEVLNSRVPNVDNVARVFDVFAYESRSAAVFAQGTAPLSERLRVTGGLRYSDDQKSFNGQAAVYCQNGSTVPFNPACPSTFPSPPVLLAAATAAEQKHDGVTWKAGVEFDLWPQSLLYASVSTGFKAGGVNQVPPGSTDASTYKPEELTAYTVGSKNRFLGGALQLNAEVFFYDYEGYQTLGVTALPGGIVSFITLNSQRAELYGGEIEAAYQIGRRTQLDVSLALLEAEFEEFFIESSGVNLAGYEMPNAPEVTLAAALQHVFPLSAGGDLTVRLQSSYRSAQWVDFKHTTGTRQEAYTRSDASIAYNSPSGAWTLSAWVRNIEDYGAIAAALVTAGTQTLGVPLPPRTFGVDLAFRF